MTEAVGEAMAEDEPESSEDEEEDIGEMTYKQKKVREDKIVDTSVKLVYCITKRIHFMTVD